MTRSLLLVLVLACLIAPRTANALSCAGNPEIIELAANCTDGVCTDVMTMRPQIYRTVICAHDTRPVVVGPRQSWLPFAEIALHLGHEVTTGVYEIHVYEDCLKAMARRNAATSWSDVRAGICRSQSLVRRVSDDAGGDAFQALRSDWEATERAGLIAALPAIVLGSFAVKILLVLATIPAIVAPWVLAFRARWSPVPTTVIVSAAIAGQTLLFLSGMVAIRMSSDMFNSAGTIAIGTFCLLPLAVAMAVQTAFLIARWGFVWLARLRARPQTPIDVT